MPPRRERIPIVLDTNVVLGRFPSRYEQSASVRIFHLWVATRSVQLILAEELFQEYLEILERLDVPEVRIAQFGECLKDKRTVTWVNLGPRYTDSRDPDDNVLLATAVAGKADFLVTNDRDLLDIPLEQTRRFRFSIIRPGDFLSRIGR